MSNKCPKCGSNLSEDAYEEITELEDCSIQVDAFPALVCTNQCGYYKRLIALPEIIAQESNDRFLLLYPGERGRILELGSMLLWPEMNVHALAGRGYWEDYNGNLDLQDIISRVRVMNEDDL
ncbi:hypothetical protein [Jeotgalibacillus malaysiensis]|uniref:hypothetical protein n=1 Tax=Jeotgalibacillus malaysiensis TaxID=1508404 RepID=UPI00384FEF97